MSHNECPICFELIVCGNNTVTTECGHAFHTNCLMTSVAHNGFGCPYCRSQMATEVRNADDFDDIDDEDDEDGEDGEDEDDDNNHDNYVLRGLRFFYNNLDGIEHDNDDIEEEEEAEREIIERLPKPSAIFIADKLIEQNVTVEQLIKCLLLEHIGYDAEDEEFTRIDETIFEKIQNIIRTYRPGDIEDREHRENNMENKMQVV